MSAITSEVGIFRDFGRQVAFRVHTRTIPSKTLRWREDARSLSSGRALRDPLVLSLTEQLQSNANPLARDQAVLGV
jgi:hypothetical protein